MGFKNLVAFMVLLSGDRVLSKAPPYLAEKFRQYTGLSINQISASDDQSGWLDMHNKAIYDAYLEKWKVV